MTGEIKIKFSAAWHTECDSCHKRVSLLHKIETPNWTKLFCDECGSLFVLENAIATLPNIEEVSNDHHSDV